MAEGYMLTDGQMRDIRWAIRYLKRMIAGGFFERPRQQVQRDRIVILDANLAAATHALTGASSCLATCCSWDSATSDYTELSEQITVWNHSEATSHVTDTFGIARWIDGHWHFFGDCEPMAAR